MRDRMRALRPKPHVEVFSTFTTRPAERLEVDWADLGFALPGSRTRIGLRRSARALAHAVRRLQRSRSRWARSSAAWIDALPFSVGARRSMFSTT